MRFSERQAQGRWRCELFGKNQGIDFKNRVRVLQAQRAEQTLKQSKIFSLIVGIIISKETTRRSKGYASTHISDLVVVVCGNEWDNSATTMDIGV